MSEYDEQRDVAPDQDHAEQAAPDEFAPDEFAPDEFAPDEFAPEELADDSASAADDPATADGAAGDGWEAPATGVAAVDDVLASVQGLDGRPVEEHVAVFEQAHDRLRRALDPGHG